MSWIPDFTTKKKTCWHLFEKKYKQGTNECYEICSKCSYRRKFRPRNLSLIPFLLPAFQQSISFPKLPLQKVRDFISEYQFFSNWLDIMVDGWRLPAVEEPYDWCGLWKTLGCLNVKAHEKLGHAKEMWLRQFQRSCYRPLCKTCVTKWIAREANKATKRIEELSKKLHMVPIHLVLSVSPDHYHYPDKKLRKIAYEVLKDLKIVGAAVVFHPYRFRESTREFYYSPQFHVVGFGYVKGRVGLPYKKYGWYTVYLGPRRSVFQTFVYILSHAGIKKGVHTVTWVGMASYSKLHIEKEPDRTICPLCNCKLEEVYYEELFHPVVPPDEIFEGWVDADGWHLVGTDPEPKEPSNFVYHPIKKVNDVLESLVLAN